MRVYYQWHTYQPIVWHELPARNDLEVRRIRSALHRWAHQNQLIATTHHCPYFPNRVLFRYGNYGEVVQYQPAPCPGMGAFCAGRRDTCTCSCGDVHRAKS